MIGAACLVWVSRVAVERHGRCVTCRVDAFWVAIGDASEGEELPLIDTRTGEPWAGEFTEAEQAEADEAMERARVMLELDRAWRKAA